MARRALIFLLAAVSFALVACGGSATSPPNLPVTNGSGNGSGSGETPSATPTPTNAPSCGCTTIKVKPVKDTLLGGIAFGQDNLIYATTPNGVDIFDQQLNVQPSPTPAAQVRIRFTWPTVPKGSVASGPVVASGSTINAIGTAPTTAPKSGSEMTVSGPVPAPTSQPFVAQYNAVTKTWFNVVLGLFGDKFVSLSAPAPNSVFVVGDHLTSSGWVGFLQGIGVACVSPAFGYPLGASAMGPDGNLWVATDPSLNTNMQSDQKNNPSILYAVDPSTGTIRHTIRLPNGSHVSAIGAGDTAVWFTDDGLNALGEVPVGGNAFSLIPLPNNGNAQKPVSISKDNIGRMWFTEFDGKRVGYITPSTQKITLFTVTGTPIGIVGCVPGQKCPQGNVFFAEPAALGNASF